MISEQLEAALMQRKGRPVGLEQQLNAFHIWGSIGIDFFITAQGAFIKCADENPDKTVEMADEVEINAALMASLTNVPELGELLPNRPQNAVKCPECQSVGQQGVFAICDTCKSLGWIVKGE